VRSTTTWADVESIVTELAAAHSGAIELQLPGIDAGADRATVGTRTGLALR
jgi:hypothetical protein